MNIERIQKAIDFGRAAHNSVPQKDGSVGQRRKYSGEPYWVHTEAVSATVENLLYPLDYTGLDSDGVIKARYNADNMIIAALLHDVLEDVYPAKDKDKNYYPQCRAYSPEAIKEQFGADVLALVIDLTDVYTKEAYPTKNRKERHTLENERLGRISPQAQTIKLADLLDNTKSIVRDDPDFAVTYMREKEELLPLLVDGSTELYALARASLEAYKQSKARNE